MRVPVILVRNCLGMKRRIRLSVPMVAWWIREDDDDRPLPLPTWRYMDQLYEVDHVVGPPLPAPSLKDFVARTFC